MSQGLPEPPVSPDTDIAGLDGFMLNTDKLMASELWALSSGDEFKAAMALWCRAWKQTPPGSLPDDERVLAAFSGAGARWSKVRGMALRGFVKCSDGRLYHSTLCDDVLRAAKKKAERKERTKAATEARQKQRDEQRNAQRDVNDDVQRNVVPGTGQGQDRDGRGQGYVIGGASAPPAKRKTRLPDDFALTPERRERLSAANPSASPDAEFSRFRDHHTAHGSLMSDWDAAWRTWCGNSSRFSKPQRPESTLLAHNVAAMQEFIASGTE